MSTALIAAIAAGAAGALYLLTRRHKEKKAHDSPAKRGRSARRRTK